MRVFPVTGSVQGGAKWYPHVDRGVGLSDLSGSSKLITLLLCEIVPWLGRSACGQEQLTVELTAPILLRQHRVPAEGEALHQCGKGKTKA